MNPGPRPSVSPRADDKYVDNIAPPVFNFFELER